MKTLYQYWQFYGKEWPIMHDITNKLFTMGTSSAALERNLSKMGFIQKKMSNRLSTASVENLVYLKTNVSMLYDYLRESSQMTEEDELVGYDDTCVVI